MTTDLFPWAMFGGDFKVFWNTGVAVLHGFSPYAVPSAFYPPLTSYLFALVALVPPVPGYMIWGMLNAAMLVHIGKGRRALAWALFFPVIFLFLAGQIDLLAIWASQYLGRKGWRSIAAVVIICLKPQMAWILLPFWVWKWAKEDRPQLLRAGLVTGALNLIPVAIRPSLLEEWVALVRSYNTGGNTATQPGLWHFAAVHPGFILPILAASIAIVLVALLVLRGEAGVRGAMVLAMPFGHGYDSSTLMLQAPAWLMVPISWIGAYLSWGRATFTGHILMPVAVLGWVLFLRLKDRKATLAMHLAPARPDAVAVSATQRAV